MMSDETRIIRYLLGEVAREYQGKLKLEIALSVFGVEPKLSDNPKRILKYVLDGGGEFRLPEINESVEEYLNAAWCQIQQIYTIPDKDS